MALHTKVILDNQHQLANRTQVIQTFLKELAKPARVGALGERDTKMVKVSSTRLVVAVGVLALSVTTGVGVASAEPDPLINTTCSYEQFVAALDAQSPDTAKAFNTNPDAQAVLHTFLDSPVDGRQQILQQAAGTPLGKELGPGVLRLAQTCNNY
jgi:hemophore-related protein